DELMQIALVMLTARSYAFSDEAAGVFRNYLERRLGQPRFAHARSVRNAIDRARLRQANRLYELGGRLTVADLMTIEPDDILKSRVFEEQFAENETSTVPEED
ncbi:MAG: CbbX protein, partial [Gaiellaceae bacterium]